MSKFFAGSDSESSSSDEELYSSSGEEDKDVSSSEEESSEEDDSEDESSDEESDEETGGAKKGTPGYYMRNQFLKGGSSAGADSDEESEDEGKRIVKSAKDKLVDEIDASIKAIENAKRINDWVAISGEFDKVNRLAERAGKQYSTTPPQYINMLMELDEFAQEAVKNEKQAKKKMNASNSRALNTIKQRIKKTSKGFETKIAAYKSDPELYQRELKGETTPQPEATASFKKTTVASTTSTTVAAADDNDGFSTVGKAGKVLQYTPENIFKTLISIVESRGKKNTDRAEQIKTLEELNKVATTPYQKISVLLMLIPIRFDLTSAGSVVPTQNWKAAEQDIRALFTVLEENASTYRVSESASEPEDIEEGPTAGPDGVKEIPGSVTSLIERLDDEFTRALQNIDPHTTEYVDRLRDEADLYTLIIRGQLYLESSLKQGQQPHTSEALSRLLVRRLDHIYYKPTSVIINSERDAWDKIRSADVTSKQLITPRISGDVAVTDKSYTIQLIDRICSVLYQQQSTIFRSKAMLSHIYHYALNDYYFKARDLFLMSHLQSSIHTADPTIQVLYNRALVQVGLCAFRIGLIVECQQSLQEICSSSRLKELLGQGVTKFGQVSAPDKQRLLPFHMHINLELLECVYLTASLLIEIPLMASLGNSIDAKKKIVSKPFRRMLDYHDRQVFSGPAENTRDHIMQAGKALLNGDWTSSRDLLTSIKIWSLLSNAEEIKTMLGVKVQEEGLRTYIFNYGSCYQSLSISILSSLFELSERKVSAIVSKMIATEEIAAALDQKSNSIVFRKGVELSNLQVLAQALADKSVQLAERNERLAAGGHQLSEQGNTSGPNKPSGQSGQGDRYNNDRSSNQRGQNRQGNSGRRENQQPRPIRA
ncbi:Nip1p [Sugiyamaella lignohabitans]|uniref:Eukaryotic translation initiation factor 3 subunit C n=1 Tax=Sugiyamaella lignohabitans TaxID=796027 RepID=A0A167EKD9_9ASCO|nr:Nip1p [Sugiyamaella lignohabitans]ANB14181.1 Nip1p [Sugiyamaella lignohabitans]